MALRKLNLAPRRDRGAMGRGQKCPRPMEVLNGACALQLLLVRLAWSPLAI